MRDRDDIPVETSEGARGRGGIGDRLVVGLAALALLSGALILAGKGLGGDTSSASASRSPTGSARASRTIAASAQPTAEAVVVEDRPLSTPEPEGPAVFSGWIRLTQDLPLYDFTSTGANRIGALAKGSFAYADEPPGQGTEGTYWLQVQAPNPTGYIAAGKGGTLFVHRYLQPPTPYAGSFSGIAAGPHRFVAWGVTSGRPGRLSTQFVAASTDGRAWRLGDGSAFANLSVQSIVYGPHGFLALANPQNGTQSSWLWRSADGLTWRRLGALPVDTADKDATLVSSGAGYLLVLASYRGNGSSETWHSPDGERWTKDLLPDGTSPGTQHVVGTRSGYYSWPDRYNPGATTKAGYSADGKTWVALEPLPMGGDGRVVAFLDGLLAVDSSPVTGSPRVWRGTLTKGGVTWTQETANLPRTFGLASLASSGTTAVLFGWDRSTEAPKAWSVSDGGWREVTLPAGAFGGTIPTLTAGSSAGFVALGSNQNLRADNPVLWSGTSLGGWAAERSPVVPPIAERTDLHCPPRPTDPAAFASLDVPSAVLCFGDSPIILRAFFASCDGCTGHSSDVYRPDWLADPQTNQLYLSPIQGEDGWWFGARRASTLADDPAWRNQWVELTGHFDDPASSQCSWVPDPHTTTTFYSVQSVINGCRQQFVVTRLRVVSGP